MCVCALNLRYLCFFVYILNLALLSKKSIEVISYNAILSRIGANYLHQSAMVTWESLTL